MRTNLRILQLNTMKSRAGMEALINDTSTRHLDMLLIQEPPISRYKTHVNHRSWHLYTPTCATEDRVTRSLLYVNKRVATSSHRQIQCNDPDVTAIKLWNTELQVLIFSIYIPPLDFHRLQELQTIKPTLDSIQNTIKDTTSKDTKPTRIIMAGDFNRHHPSWSGRQVHHTVMSHSGELLQFMHEQQLQMGLPRGTPTYWSLHKPGTTSTIDLTLTNAPERIVKCELYHENYGSDHQGTYLEWDLKPIIHSEPSPRKAYDRTDWAKVGKDVLAAIEPSEPIASTTQLDAKVDKLIRAVQQAVEKHAPLLRPSPYSKRWFTPELKQQQASVNKARRKWQESCATRGKNDEQTRELFNAMYTKRREWTKAIERAKYKHWKEFLDSAKSSTTLWKAATFMKPRDNYANIPPLRAGDGEIHDNAEKARVFLESFFPDVDEPEAGPDSGGMEELEWHPLTEVEIERVLKAAKGKKAPGIDGLPMLAWKNLWTYISGIIFQIFNASIDLGYYPRQWKMASIIVLRKPGKTDYTVPEAYRPISLLNTLGKLLEAVMAKRLAYWAESHHLLPDTQFGGRAGRTTEQALLILANAIDRAWMKNKLVTLVAFDLKNAFNSVNAETLDARLEEKGIPMKARNWIRSFMEDRSASLKFDDFTTAVTLLAKAGLAQGSPLSPILFDFFNSDLVDQPVDFKGGASAFIDDYFRWRVGKTAEENIRKIQEEDIPRVEAWARRTGARFSIAKTELIHLTRKKKEVGAGSITFEGTTINATPTAKLLGIVFDSELRWKHQVQQALKRASKAVSALSGLRHLRPFQMRQLYTTCVVPVIDYASTVWHNPLKDKTHLRTLNTIQRDMLIRILSAFRTTATQAMEMEAYVPPTRLRLKRRGRDVVASLFTRPKDHPIHGVLERASRRAVAKGDAARLPIAQVIKTMDMTKLRMLKTLDPRPLEPWKPPGPTKNCESRKPLVALKREHREDTRPTSSHS